MILPRLMPPAAAFAIMGLACAASAQTNSELARRIIEKQSDAACALLPNDEVVRMTGRRSVTKPEGVQLKNGGSSCSWSSGVNVNMYSGPNSAQQLEDLLKRFKADKSPRQPVGGIGDRAFMTHMMLGKYQGNHALLIVHQGQHALGISLEAEAPETPESVQPKLMSVARAALARLR
ncbi:MAG: hypothetical protein ABI696_05600 [Rubrivivax sp.]